MNEKSKSRASSPVLVQCLSLIDSIRVSWLGKGVYLGTGQVYQAIAPKKRHILKHTGLGQPLIFKWYVI